MKTTEFNLLDEPWIKVMTSDCSVKEISLTDALLDAQDYSCLKGELPIQDAAVLRLLLAVLFTIFSRSDPSGTPSEFKTPGDAFTRWQALWQAGRFPEKPVRSYLDSQHEKFWLFHPERPFWQVPGAKGGTEYEASKLNGEISESSNKLRLFPVYSGAEKKEMTYSKAARWLLNVNACDDTSAKPKKKGLPSPGCGWLGKLGFIEVLGSNLFETLMLNLTFLQDGEKLWGNDLPCWELSAQRELERSEISVPNSPAAMYTLQSRRLLLKRDGDLVTGYSLLGGDFFPKENAFSEQMTLWGPVYNNKREIIGFQPRRHDPSRQIWREFPSAFLDNESENVGHIPGLVRWISALNREKCLNGKKMISFSIASVQYGDKDFFISDSFQDNLSFHTGLLSEMGKIWRKYISEEIERCNKLAFYIARLRNDLAEAAGMENNDLGAQAKEQFYFLIDEPFRRWLSSIDPQMPRTQEYSKREEWRETAQRIARDFGRELVATAGEKAFFGKNQKEEKSTHSKSGSENTVRHLSSPEALGRFLYMVKKTYNS
jgi:CRISPR system Cascade subunit CasA